MKHNVLGLFFFLTILISGANGQNYIISTGGLLDQRAGEQINTIANEVHTKLGVNIYLDIKGDNGIDPESPLKERIDLMKQKEAELLDIIVKDFNNTKPFVLLTIAIDQKYANILYSDDLKSAIDKDSILDGYVIPLLAAFDKNTLNSKASAAALNGFAQIADVLAENKGIKLDSSIGSEGKVASSIWRVFMYTLVVAGIILYFVIVLREKKIKKEFEEKNKREENNE